MDTDRNLLFGVLALQADLIDAVQFADICASWTARKQTPIADLLVERGWISLDDKAAVEHLMKLKLKKHDGNPSRSLIEVADDEVRRALAALAVDDEDLQSSVEQLTSRQGHVVVSVLEHAPEARERYSLTRLHAKGGIGQVWLARDADFGREVALKELRPERAARPEIWARFLEEARITGRLEHPGIVPIYEMSKRGNDGQPFYTMRFVKGRTLTEAAHAFHDKRDAGEAVLLELRALLNAFVGVCNAVAYAHSKGVIHRDLKGQNVILGDFGEVIVLDWGLAKTTDPIAAEFGAGPEFLEDAGRSPTAQGRVLGTPAYMSPEQARGDAGAVDRRSDVYGLGAILYEILVGGPPFTGVDTHEILRKVREQEPTRPRRYWTGIPRALEAVCLKALSKRPENRYQTANELTAEVQRFLADEPVRAWREPLPVRLARWTRKHRTAVTAAIAVLLVTSVGLAVSNGMIRREQAKTKDEWNRAERNFLQAFQAADRYFTRVSESRLLNVPGLQPLRKELLADAADFYREFVRERRGDSRLQGELARAYQRLAALTASNESVERAIALDGQAIEILERLARERPNELGYRRDLGAVHVNLAYRLTSVGAFADAEAAYLKSEAIFEALSSEAPNDSRYRRDLAKSYNNRGLMYMASGDLSKARDAFDEALKRREALLLERPEDIEPRTDVAESLGNSANVAAASKRVPEAEERYNRTIELFGKLAEERPEILQYQIAEADARVGLGILLRQTGRATLAESALLKALKIRETLADRNPTVAEYRHNHALVLGNLAEVLQSVGRLEQAETSFRKARVLWEDLSKRFPEVSRYRRDLAATLASLGMLHIHAGRLEQAEAADQAALTYLERLIIDEPNVSAHRIDMARLRGNLGEVQARLKRVIEAETSFREAIKSWENLIKSLPDSPVHRSGLAWTENALGKLLAAQGKSSEAEAAFDRSLKTHERLVADHPKQIEFPLYLGETLGNKAGLLRDRGRFNDAVAVYDRAIGVFEDLLKREPRFAQAGGDLLLALQERANALGLAGRYADALKDWDRVISTAGPVRGASFRLGRAATLARSGDHVKAAAETEAITNVPIPPATCYDAACVESLAAGAAIKDASLSRDDRRARFDRLAASAVSRLRSALALGFFRDPAAATRLKQDPDIDPIRATLYYRLLLMDIAFPNDPFMKPR